MIIIEDIPTWKEVRKNLSNKKIGFVPTMGNLHDGHKSLLNKSASENDITVLSVFVNQTQFNNNSDFERYPRTTEHDANIAEEAGIDYLLMPMHEQIYPDNYNFQLSEKSEFGLAMEGAHRPGHFTGMLTIVMKLLLLVNPTRAYFGEKDFQQLTLVKNMVEAFLMDVEIISCPTIRNFDTLPLSSRNNLLSEEELKKASFFSKLLSSNLLPQQIKIELENNGFKVDYIEEHDKRKFGAVWVGNVRLIDNFKG